MTTSQLPPPSGRLFVALPVPASVRASLVAALERSSVDDRRLRRTRPERWHVTLAFLGDTPLERLPDVAAVVASALRRRPLPDELRLGSPGRFGDHTLWVGVDESPPGSLRRLGADIQAGLADADLPVTQRTVTPHITLARARRRGRVSRTDVEALGHLPTIPWQPLGVEVWQAHLGDGPARYSTEASIPDTGHRNEGRGSAATT